MPPPVIRASSPWHLRCASACVALTCRRFGSSATRASKRDLENHQEDEADSEAYLTDLMRFFPSHIDTSEAVSSRLNSVGTLLLAAVPVTLAGVSR